MIKFPIYKLNALQKFKVKPPIKTSLGSVRPNHDYKGHDDRDSNYKFYDHDESAQRVTGTKRKFDTLEVANTFNNKKQALDKNNSNNIAPQTTKSYIAGGKFIPNPHQVSYYDQLTDLPQIVSKNIDKLPPIYKAIQTSNENLIEEIVEDEGSLNIVDQLEDPSFISFTPLIYAISLGNTAITKLLISSNADPLLKNHSGTLPSDIPRYFGNADKFIGLLGEDSISSASLDSESFNEVWD